MNKLFLLLLTSMVILSVSMVASAEKMESVMGSVQGYDCIMSHRVCPIGHEDIEAAGEESFVLLTNAKTADYYVLPNVTSIVLARHLNEEVKVVGYVDKQRKSIWVEEIYKGTKLVWSNKMHREHGSKK